MMKDLFSSYFCMRRMNTRKASSGRNATVCPSWENYILSRVEEPLKEVLAIRTPSLLVTNDRLQETMFPFHSLYSHLHEMYL